MIRENAKKHASRTKTAIRSNQIRRHQIEEIGINFHGISTGMASRLSQRRTRIPGEKAISESARQIPRVRIILVRIRSFTYGISA